MSSFFDRRGGKLPTKGKARPSIDLIHKMECKACPLRFLPNHNQDMPATGSKHPVIYVLGEAPGQKEDETGRQFVGKSGKFIRDAIPDDWFNDPEEKRHKTPEIRWNNTVRTRPPGNATPGYLETESCRPSVQRDIEAAQPKVILCVGGLALQWATGLEKISVSSGSFIPVKIGQHKCWAFGLYHPSFIMRKKSDSHETTKFYRDLEYFFEAVRDLPDAKPIDKATLFDDISIYYGANSTDLEQIERKLKKAAEYKYNGFDIETHSDELNEKRFRRPYGKGTRILSASVTWAEGTVAFGLDHPGCKWTHRQRKKLDEIFKAYLCAKDVVKLCHYVQFELEWTIYFYGPEVARAGKWGDSMAQVVCIEGGRKGAMSLDYLSTTQLGLPIKSVVPVDVMRLIEHDIKEVLRYNSLDSKAELAIWLKNRKRIKEVSQRHYDDLIRSAITVVLSQNKGACVDFPFVEKWHNRLAKRLSPLEAKIDGLKVVKKYEKDKGPYNPASTPQTLAILRDYMHRTEIEVVDKYTGETKEQADEKVLEKIDHPFCSTLLKWREWRKLKNTYIDPLLEDKGKQVWTDGKIHTSFNLYVTRTWRLSSEDPNVQNYPARQHREIRAVIVANRPGKQLRRKLLACDYGQIEFRVIGMASGDKKIIESCFTGFDVHGYWAKRLAESYPKRVGGEKALEDPQVLKDFRSEVKNSWVFPAFYGAKLESIAGYLKIPVNVLKPQFDEFWDTYEGVRKWQSKLIRFYEKHGYVETLTGKRRYGPLSPNELINMPIQGQASEIVVDAMCRLSERAQETNDWNLQAIFNIHDDLTFSVPVDRLKYYRKIIVKEMLTCPFDFINVPLTLELKAGYNWAEMELIGEYSSEDLK